MICTMYAGCIGELLNKCRIGYKLEKYLTINSVGVSTILPRTIAIFMISEIVSRSRNQT